MAQPAPLNNLRIETRGAGRYVLHGALTFDTVPRLYGESDSLLNHDAATLTLDLQGVQRTDSAGLALLMEWLRRARSRNKDIHFENIPPQMLAMARLSGLDSILPLDQSL
ncbi:MAG: STAS domain-containing protein [Pseudomonadota bacterium]